MTFIVFMQDIKIANLVGMYLPVIETLFPFETNNHS